MPRLSTLSLSGSSLGKWFYTFRWYLNSLVSLLIINHTQTLSLWVCGGREVEYLGRDGAKLEARAQAELRFYNVYD